MTIISSGLARSLRVLNLRLDLWSLSLRESVFYITTHARGLVRECVRVFLCMCVMYVHDGCDVCL